MIQASPSCPNSVPATRDLRTKLDIGIPISNQPPPPDSPTPRLADHDSGLFDLSKIFTCDNVWGLYYNIVGSAGGQTQMGANSPNQIVGGGHAGPCGGCEAIGSGTVAGTSMDCGRAYRDVGCVALEVAGDEGWCRVVAMLQTRGGLCAR